MSFESLYELLYNTFMTKTSPNPETYRPLLGKEANLALFKLVAQKNKVALSPLGVNIYLRKMIAHWWVQEFPDEECPIKTKPYNQDLDIVQSA